MSESKLHASLVQHLIKWITVKFASEHQYMVFVDHSGGEGNCRPPIIGNSVPDVYIPPINNFGPIIGEAKTSSDLESRHSIVQLKDFLSGCHTSKTSELVLAVPWEAARTARNLLRQLKKQLDVEYVTSFVIDKLPA